MPRVLNVAGLVPRVVFGDEAGDIRHRSLLIVPAASPNQRLADVRGGEVFLTEPGSNSGYPPLGYTSHGRAGSRSLLPHPVYGRAG